ncbi:MAG TPA: GDSL-type esterase/lipase family protein [Azospira sp.]|nr:GDSL-type esterase/lipase family protein [Azospira sp.]
MNRRHCLRLLVTMAVAAALAACGRTPKLAPLPAGASVLAFGDSVTFGTGAAPGEDWPTRLAALSGWRIVNAGIPGDTAANGKERIAALVEEHRPALVIVEIGGNDFLKRRPPAAVKEDLRQIVAAARAGGAQVVLVAVPELSLLGAVTRKPSDAAIYAELGKEERLPVIEDVFADILGTAELRTDPIHPNARGYERMAVEFHSALRKIGLLR